MTTLEEEGGATERQAAAVIPGMNAHALLEDAKVWLKFNARRMDTRAVQKAVARIKVLEYALRHLTAEYAHLLAPKDAEYEIELDEPTD